MRISDWSSDVCSSDLPRDIIIFVRAELTDEGRTTERLFDRLAVIDAGGDRFGQRRVDDIALSPLELRAAAGSEQGGEAEHDEARARGKGRPFPFGNRPHEGGTDRKSTRLNSSH